MTTGIMLENKIVNKSPLIQEALEKMGFVQTNVPSETPDPVGLLPALGIYAHQGWFLPFEAITDHDQFKSDISKIWYFHDFITVKI